MNTRISIRANRSEHTIATPFLRVYAASGPPPVISTPTQARRAGLLFAFLALGLSITLWAKFDATNPEVQFVERYEWIPSIGVEYFVGADGLGLLMLLLSSSCWCPFSSSGSPG